MSVNKKILFSPVGGTDPISNFRDASMLHISRVYRPDVIYMFLSKEMYERHEKDNRYCYCLDRLGEMLNHKFEYRFEIRKDLKKVYDFDYFYKVFSREVFKIRKNMDDSDILYVNISSGTPAMKSALLLLAAISDYKFIPIQVTTPVEQINPHLEELDRNYDVKEYWETNDDNTVFINRCNEVKSVQLFRILKADLIRKHIDSFDYNAAYATYETIKDTKKVQNNILMSEDPDGEENPDSSVADERINKMLKMAVCRSNLDISETKNIMKDLGIDIMPVKNGEYIKIFEYSMVVWLKLQRKEYADYARALTPLLWQLYVMILKKQCSLDVMELAVKSKNTYRWDKAKLNSRRDILDILNARYNGNFKCGEVSNSNLNTIVYGMVKDAKLKKEIKIMDKVELNIRNIVAHTITMITDDVIVKKAEVSAKQIFDKIKYLMVVAGVPVNSESWQTYEQMNTLIKEELDSIF